MNLRIVIVHLIAVVFLGVGVSCGGSSQSAAGEMCELDCLKAGREKVATCGDDQACKQDAAAELRSCNEACPE